MTTERWAPIPTAPGYEASDAGRIRSLRRGVRVLRFRPLPSVVGPCPPGMECCHNNGNRADNRLENLRWDTKLANADDIRRHGTHGSTRKTECPRGHPLVAPNLIPAHARRGHRTCLACSRANGKRRSQLRAYGYAEDFEQLAEAYFAEIMQFGAFTKRRRKRCLSNRHELTEANTIVSKNGKRKCRTCTNEGQARARTRRKATTALDGLRIGA